MNTPEFFRDAHDLLDEFREEEGEFIVVGAHALTAHGIVRATSDFDLWVRPTVDNAQRVVSELLRFGAPLEAHGVDEDDFARPDTV
jgi:hypothetical protein